MFAGRLHGPLAPKEEGGQHTDLTFIHPIAEARAERKASAIYRSTVTKEREKRGKFSRFRSVAEKKI